MDLAAMTAREKCDAIVKFSKDAIPLSTRNRMRRLFHPAFLGSLRRTTPIGRAWGFDRGTPIDRYYIERFLAEHRQDIRGRVLEVKDSTYTDRFATGVTERDVLDIDPDNPRSTIVADLAAADDVPSNRFDCFILTQTLQFVYDTRAAIGHAYRILRPGGTLLVTVPAVSRAAARASRDYWRFTIPSCSRLFTEVFRPEDISIAAYGNVLVNIAFLEGMASEELKPHELEVNDEEFPLIVTVRAVKSAG
jgi:SAM-dependent methyltransferase